MSKIKQSSSKSKKLEKKLAKSQRYSSKSKSCSSSPAKSDSNLKVLKSCLRSRSDSDVNNSAVKKKVSFLIPRKAPVPSKVVKSAKMKAMETKGLKASIKQSCSEIIRDLKKFAEPLDNFSSDMLTALNENCAPASLSRPQNSEN